MATRTHDSCEVKIAMLEDDNEALKKELLLAYQEIERYKNPLWWIVYKLNGGGDYEFKYSSKELGALDT